MKKIMTGAMVTAITFSGIIPINVMNNQHVYAEEQKVIDLSNSLKKLGAESQLTQVISLDIQKTPNVKLTGLPSLNSSQNELKQSITEWLEDFQPRLLSVNQEDMRFLRKHNSYHDSMKDFIDDPKKEDKEKFLKMLMQLQTQNQLNAEKIAKETAKLTSFKADLNGKTQDLFAKTDKGYELLTADKAGQRTELIAEIESTKKDINTDLEKIAELPDNITKSAWDVFEFANKKSKLIIDQAVASWVAVYEKGKELNIELDKIKDSIKKDGKDKTESRIEQAEKEFWEKHKNEQSLAGVAATGKFDFSKGIDPAEIRKFIDQMKQTQNLSQRQLESLQDIIEKNQKLYELTKDLKITDIQIVSLTEMKENFNVFTYRINSQINLLTAHKTDIENIGKVISNLSQMATQSEVNQQELKKNFHLLKSLCEELENQTKQFEIITTK